MTGESTVAEIEASGGTAFGIEVDVSDYERQRDCGGATFRERVEIAYRQPDRYQKMALFLALEIHRRRAGLSSDLATATQAASQPTEPATA